jgi:hypothetical protein
MKNYLTSYVLLYQTFSFNLLHLSGGVVAVSEHRAMPDPALPFPSVRIRFSPYDHDQVQDFLFKVYQEFGRDKTRWYYRSPDIGELYPENNAWVLDFYFSDPNDAMIFGLKYQR